jgi:hypothetical protein
MAIPFRDPVDFGYNEIQNVVAQNLAGAPTSPAPVKGQFYFDSITNHLYVYNGTVWEAAVSSGVASVTVNAPLTNSGTAGDPVINLPAAGAAQNGYLTSTDYNTLHAATDANTASAIVKRDANGDFAARNITATKVTGLATPVADTDGTPKGYVDGLVNGAQWGLAVRAVATANQGALSGLPTIDGVTLVNNDRLLLIAQTTGSQNGPWVVHSGAWTRPTDYASAGVVPDNRAYFVEEGTANAESGWTLTTNGAITVDTTSTAWTKFTGLGSISVTTPIIKTGDTLSLGTVPVANGGTGGTDAAGAKTNLAFMTRYAVTIGDGSTTSYTITHNLGTTDVHVQVWETGGSKRQVIAEIQIIDGNSVRVLYSPAPATNAIRVVVVG